MDLGLSAVGAGGRKRGDGNLIRLATMATMNAKERVAVQRAVKELQAGATELR